MGKNRHNVSRHHPRTELYLYAKFQLRVLSSFWTIVLSSPVSQSVTN